jgi:hypothetical protein
VFIRRLIFCQRPFCGFFSFLQQRRGDHRFQRRDTMLSRPRSPVLLGQAKCEVT